ncbi:MoaD/ThiS family protein [Candidatus Bathyarchaeota archaeon]|nr:MoaD/ThiS family protein [Candidatus Bathyarchaeota archaeon]
MRVRVVAFGELAQILGKEQLLNLPEGSDLSALLSLLTERSGSERGYLGRYRVAEEVAILLNGRNIHLLEGMRTRIRDGDTVYLLLPFAGG